MEKNKNTHFDEIYIEFIGSPYYVKMVANLKFKF